MSAQLDNLPALRPMGEVDLDAVMAVERDVYPFPWTRGNFADSLAAGYGCWVMDCARGLVGYGVLMLAANESHLLNLTVAREWQRQGFGHVLLRHFLHVARAARAESLFLEVRPSNHAARELYAGYGFRQLAVRRGYYPAAHGREDALLLGVTL